MICDVILKLGQDRSCFREEKRYYNEAVLIHKSDVESYSVKVGSTLGFLEEIPHHEITFKLKTDAEGLYFGGNPNKFFIYGTSTHSRRKGINRYTHFVQIPTYGIDERAKYILHTLDQMKDYFMALKHKSGVVEIFGFGSGLETNDYTLNGQNQINMVQLSTPNDFLEYNHPLVYKSDNPIRDFDSFFTEHFREFTYEFTKEFT